MSVRFFRSAAEWRRWLEAHHDDRTELWAGFHKARTGKGITHREALDEALCFGWIDGVRRPLDDDRYAIRFSPRQANSFWSSVNTARARELIEFGRMTGAGLEAFERRDEDRTRRLDRERARAALGPDEERELRANRKAWGFFQAQPPGYRRTVVWWVVSGKRAETRRRRLEALIDHSAKGVRVPLLAPPARN